MVQKASGGRGGKILLVLAIIVAVSALVGVAWWLFARPPDDVFDEVPDDFRGPEGESASEAPQGFAARAKQRFRSAIRAGQRASRDEQLEQEQRVRELTGQSMIAGGPSIYLARRGVRVVDGAALEKR